MSHDPSDPSDLPAAPAPEAPGRLAETPAQLFRAVRDRTRFRHYSLRTERAYVQWIRRFITFAGRRHPRELGAAEVTAFLGALATERSVAPATQNQALAAVLFLYRDVLGIELPWLANVPRARKGHHLPTALTRTEVSRLFEQMSGVHALMARLQYGTGMRLMECLRLRIKDVDLERREIVIREGKGARDRITMLPATLVEPLRAHLEVVRALHEEDLRNGVPGVELPHALERKNPSAGTSWA